MREILFRGKRVDNGEWVEGFYTKQRDSLLDGIVHHYIVAQEKNKNGLLNPLLTWYIVIPETVGQFTGLTANGTKIFEGDIVWGDDCSGTWHKGIVEYDDNLGCFIVNAQNFMQYPKNEDCYCLSGHWCVEGNIHDNEELLKEGAEG